MDAILRAGPAVEPVSLEDVKAHLRLDGTDEDAVLARLIPAARETVERGTRLLLIAQKWRLRVSLPRPGGSLGLAIAPVTAISAARLLAEDGGETPLAAEDYRLDGTALDGRVQLRRRDAIAPGTRLELDLTTGFGPDPADVPEPLRLAIRQLVAFWYGQRGDGLASGQEAAPWPPELRALLAPFVRRRLA